MNISAKYKFFGKVRNFRTLQKNSDFTKKFILYDFHTSPKNSYFMIFILYQKIRTLLKYSRFAENFVVYQKIHTPDEQVLKTRWNICPLTRQSIWWKRGRKSEKLSSPFSMSHRQSTSNHCVLPSLEIQNESLGFCVHCVPNSVCFLSMQWSHFITHGGVDCDVMH